MTDHAFRFRHLLIRDTAYDALPKRTRADLHERLGTWLEESVGDLAELDAIAGWHLEQAVRYRHELGEETESLLARRAAEHLCAASSRARARDDAAAALRCCEHALAILPKDDPLQSRIGSNLAELLNEAGKTPLTDELPAEGQPDPRPGHGR